MATPELFEVGLFRHAPDGSLSMVGASTNESLIANVRRQIAAERRRELVKLEDMPFRLVPPQGGTKEPE